MRTVKCNLKCNFILTMIIFFLPSKTISSKCLKSVKTFVEKVITVSNKQITYILKSLYLSVRVFSTVNKQTNVQIEEKY